MPIVTLQDVARRLDPDGKVDKIIEMLTEENEILKDLHVRECNDGTSHITTVRTGLPQATWRLLNYGVPKGKSKTAQITDHVGMLEVYAEIDKKLVELNGNEAAFCLSEDKAFLEGMSQQLAETLFYGDESTPEKFVGLAPRFNDLSAPSGRQIVDAGGTGDDNTSIWLVCWGDDSVHGLYPKGSSAGFKHEPLGEQTLTDEDGGMYQGYRTHYSWDLGLTVRDWRCVARVANIDVSNLESGVGAANLIQCLIKAYHKLPKAKRKSAVIYCNDTIETALDLQAVENSNVNLRYGEQQGEEVLKFRRAPIRCCDQILDTESRVV